ncbi:hypothetical protein EV643_110107 [Kribbella sp. VKM Ac-2527]|uniref:Uncharacterized protein n=1 Tax=Kribbella caucasensis TaxID=2512215 RepID=A0A4R6K9X9_9ACTN|nr:hypothetical protein [Kribbella sp. VKM Ac-2527]TDO46724.1 hypothetical protein EV643_110107 [Kribbella sp. VKM Ac-2527]
MTANPNDTMAALADASVTVLPWPPPEPPSGRSAGSRYVVLALAGHGPVAVAEGAGDFRPAVVIGAEVRLADLVAADGMSLLDLDPYGLVVVDADTVVGVVPGEVLDEYLGAGQAPVPRPMGPLESAAGGQLHGSHTTPAAVVMCAAPGCNHPNPLAFFDRRHPPACANPDQPPHLLAVPGLG